MALNFEEPTVVLTSHPLYSKFVELTGARRVRQSFPNGSNYLKYKHARNGHAGIEGSQVTFDTVFGGGPHRLVIDGVVYNLRLYARSGAGVDYGAAFYNKDDEELAFLVVPQDSYAQIGQKAYALTHEGGELAGWESR